MYIYIYTHTRIISSPSASYTVSTKPSVFAFRFRIPDDMDWATWMRSWRARRCGAHGMVGCFQLVMGSSKMVGLCWFIS